MEIVTESRSNDIKIGVIGPLVPEEDLVSREELNRMKYERYLPSRSRERNISLRKSKSGRDIQYRHVRVVDETDQPEPRRRKVVFTSWDAVDGFNDKPSPEPPTAPEAPTAPEPVTTSPQMRQAQDPPPRTAQTVKGAAVRKMDSTKASVSTQVSTGTRPSGSTSIALASAKMTHHAKPHHIEVDIRKIAREEVDRYGKTFQRPERSEADIRRISREEVQNYREAERKLDAHPDPYAHGRLVPIERRIATEKDVSEPAPWSQSSKQNKPSGPVETKPQHHTKVPVSVSKAEEKDDSHRLSRFKDGFKDGFRDGFKDGFKGARNDKLSDAFNDGAQRRSQRQTQK